MVNRSDIPQLFGRDLYDPDGSKVGTVDDVYLDAGTGEPEWLAVKTGLFGLKQSFVPLGGAELTGDRVVVPFGKAQVKDAPRIDPDGQLSHAEENELYRYYGITGGSEGYGSKTGGEQSRSEQSRSGQSRSGQSRSEQSRDSRGERSRSSSRRDAYPEQTGGTRSGDDTRTGAGRHSAGTGGTGTGSTGGTSTGTGRAGAGDGDAMTRSEERLVGGTRTEETGKARLRKYVVTEQERVTVPVQREEVRVEREPITGDNRDSALSGPAISESEHEVTLRAERPVVNKEAVPVERVRLGKQTVTDEEEISDEVRKERIAYEDGTDRRDRR